MTEAVAPKLKPMILVYCREGFEAEAGQELAAMVVQALGLQRQPLPVTVANSAFAILPLASTNELMALRRKLPIKSLIFARQLAFGFGPLDLGEAREGVLDNGGLKLRQVADRGARIQQRDG